VRFSSFVKNQYLFFCFVFVFLTIAKEIQSQSYQYKNYNTENGISQPFIYSINQDKNGYLWIATGDELLKFDGLSFKKYTKKDGLADNFVTSSYKDNNRNLWFGHNQGSITFFDGKKFKAINTSKFIQSPITGITSDKDGNTWFSTLNDGVLRVSKNFEVQAFNFEFSNQNIYSIAFTINNQMLVGTAEGLLLYELRGERLQPKLIEKIKIIPSTKINCIVKKRGLSPSLWIGTEDEGLYKLTVDANNKSSAEKITNANDETTANITAIVEDKEANLWLGTFGNGMIKLILSEKKSIYDGIENLPETSIDNKFIKCLYYDHEGNVWVGKYGTGLTQITDNFFTFFYNKNKDISNNITAISIYGTTTWLGTDNGLILANFNNTSANSEIALQLDAIGNHKITSIYQPDSLTLYIGTENDGMYLYKIKTNQVKKIDLSKDGLSDAINRIIGDDKNMWVATKIGLFKINNKDKSIKIFNTENGLPHNNIHDVIFDHNKNIIVATNSNYLSIIDTSDNVEQKKAYDGNDLTDIISIIEDKSYNIWAATSGHGVIKLSKNKIERFDIEEGLKSNFCYSIVNDGYNNIWVGHSGGLSKINKDNNNIVHFSKEENIYGDCNKNSFFVDKYGRSWFGTDKGLIRFDPTKEKRNDIPPMINIISIKINDSLYDTEKDIILPFGKYNIEITYLGVSFKVNPHITYQYKLEGYDDDWSNKNTNTVVNYGKFSEGNYTFLLKAYNNDGISNELPLSINIKIKPPFWKNWWFLLLVIVIFFYSIYLIIKIRERNHRIFQAQLQKELNIKTKEVIEQKAIIEKKNKDITDSIRYAKRIQDAILRDISKLKDVFPESYIFFQPRDIVSGDFYWFELYGTKLIVACADATGHGVPGSLMSMIGTIFIKDITSRPHILSPAHALETLENEIKILLQQQEENADNTSDSIDLILCELDIKTYKARISTTKRPILLSSENAIAVVKKEKSVGEFETIDLQLKKGDTLYLFTDGFADQFGGQHGKKLKMPNIVSMLEDMHHLPAEKQRMIVDRFFNRWKEGYDQVDDVLFMGIKI